MSTPVAVSQRSAPESNLEPAPKRTGLLIVALSVTVANLALLHHPNVFNLRVVADFGARVQRVRQREGLD